MRQFMNVAASGSGRRLVTRVLTPTAYCLQFLILCVSAMDLAAKDDAKLAPAPGQIFTFSPTNPKWVTCDIEFRHPDEKLWPVFLYGKPVDGTFQYDAANPKASFHVVFDHMAQPHGDQSRRILGELIKPAGNPQTPIVTFSVKSLKLAAVPDALKAKERKGRGDPAELEAVLSVDSKNVPVKAAAFISYRAEKILILQIDSAFTVQGADLGLNAENSKAAIAIHVCVQAVAGQESSGKKN